MDNSVPPAAAILLGLLESLEAPAGCYTIYGNNQCKLKVPLTR